MLIFILSFEFHNFVLLILNEVKRSGKIELLKGFIFYIKTSILVFFYWKKFIIIKIYYGKYQFSFYF